jgi:parallel beta-helix repeat protein
MGGNDHLLEYNEFHDLMKLSGDAGAIYMGRNWTYRGNEIRYNYFHDLIGENWGVGNMGVYLDDLASGMHVYGNIFHRCYRSVQIGGGRDNIVENNIFYDNHFSLRIDARGTSRHRKLQIGRRSGESWDMFHKLNEVPFDRPPYSLKYPLLALILFDEPLEPKGNIIRNNISVKSEFVKARPERIKDDPEWFSFGENFVDKDPLFMDAEKDDFRLRKESPAWEMGFEEIPWEKIGLQLDEFRTTK